LMAQLRRTQQHLNVPRNAIDTELVSTGDVAYDIFALSSKC
jgi:hypothetical protein